MQELFYPRLVAKQFKVKSNLRKEYKKTQRSKAEKSASKEILKKNKKIPKKKTMLGNKQALKVE